MDQRQSEELRERIRAEVIAALQRHAGGAVAATQPAQPAAKAEGTRQLIVVFMGDEAPADECFTQVASLAQQGYSLRPLFSYTFSSLFDADSIGAKLPGGAAAIKSEAELRKAVAVAAGVIAPAVSLNTAAKLGAGISDSLPSIAIAGAVARGIPVFVAHDIAALGRSFADAHSAAAPAVTRTFENALHRMQQMGVSFVECAKLGNAVADAFHVPINETPERLARTRPSPKRQFITAEDVWKALSTGQKEIRHQRDAMVTDQAREYAADRGIALVSE